LSIVVFMSYSLNGPQSAEEASAHFDNVCLGLHTCRVVKYLFKIKDAKGRLPAAEGVPYLKILEALRRNEEIDFLALEQGEYATYTFYDVLKEVYGGTGAGSRKVKGLLEKISDRETQDGERLELAAEGIKFFSALSRKALVHSEYPNVGIPEGVRELARSMAASDES